LKAGRWSSFCTAREAKARDLAAAPISSIGAGSEHRHRAGVQAAGKLAVGQKMSAAEPGEESRTARRECSRADGKPKVQIRSSHAKRKPPDTKILKCDNEL
jgi:hypothetical protein